MRHLISKGADINTHDQVGRTPLHIASESANEALLQMLIDHGADLDAQDDLYESPLIKAAKRGDAAMGLHLIRAGAHPDVLDSMCLTALAWACSRGEARLVRELAPRTRPHPKPEQEGSPLWWAKHLGRDDLVEILEAEAARREAREGEAPALMPPHTNPPLGLFETIPVSFTIPIKINGLVVDAFVSTGTQTSMIGVECAARTGLSGLVDTRFAQKVQGLSPVDATGRIHLLVFSCDGVSYKTSAEMLNYPGFDFILGLDFLKRHGGQVNISDNTLTLRGGEANAADGAAHGMSKDIVNVVQMSATGVKGKRKA